MTTRENTNIDRFQELKKTRRHAGYYFIVVVTFIIEIVTFSPDHKPVSLHTVTVWCGY